jgi:adenine-specific DNA-methyltransferase
MDTEQRNDISRLSAGTSIYRHDNLTSQSGTDKSRFPVSFDGIDFVPGRGYWKTNPVGMARLLAARRLGAPTSNSLTYVRFLDDFPLAALSNVWTDTQTGAFTDAKMYVVQTNTKVIERCLLMTTDPGDLALDPTCGSGTTAYVAEQWGRRWITMDTSRVALALARQRLMTAKFDYFELRPLNDDDRRRNPDGPWLKNGDGASKTLDCETVPHVTLKSIAQNTALDAIFARYQPVLDEKL